MVYIVSDGNSVRKLVLVKAESSEVVESRLKLREGEVIVGYLTDADIQALSHSIFAVIQL